MAFQKGNQLAAKGKPFFSALKRAIAQDDGQRIRDAAEKLLDLAAAGEAWAMKELIDRLDGKPLQESVVELIDQRASEVDDATLLNIAAGSRDRTAEAESGSQVTH